jgi:hypothetical protein
MDFIAHWSEHTEIRALQLVCWIGLSRSKFYSWRNRYGKANEHNALVPRDHWLEPWEKVAIINFHHQCPREGYRRLTFMMLDRNVVAVSPSSTYRVLKAAGLLQRWNPKPSGKGNGFQQPLEPHEHWHVDISYLNIAGTFFYLCSVLDGCSEFPVALGIAHRDDGARRRDRLAASSRKISGYFPADHYRQRAAVYCQGLQGVYPPGGSDPCQNLPLLPAKQRENRAMAPEPQSRLSQARLSAFPAGWHSTYRALRYPLQHRAAALGHRVCCPG